MSERNRDQPASATHKDCSFVLDENAGRYIYRHGLTKREAAAIAIAAGIRANPSFMDSVHELVLKVQHEDGPDWSKSVSGIVAHYAVEDANALFDELDGDKT